MFFHFHQNNSGGRYVGPTDVIIEAENAQEANSLATSSRRVEIYFDGCSSGRDCYCCGDRWTRAEDDAAKSEPCWYHLPLGNVDEEWCKSLFGPLEVMVISGDDSAVTWRISVTTRECTDEEFDEYHSINHRVHDVTISNDAGLNEQKRLRSCKDRNFWEWVARHSGTKAKVE